MGNAYYFFDADAQTADDVSYNADAASIKTNTVLINKHSPIVCTQLLIGVSKIWCEKQKIYWAVDTSNLFKKIKN